MDSPYVPLIYVVDDEPIIASTVALILKGANLRAESFTNPAVALETATKRSPDLLISDVFMPQMSGVELAVQTSERCPSCRILLFSGQTVTSDLLSYAQHRGYEFELARKPIHPSELIQKVEAILRGDNERHAPSFVSRERYIKSSGD